MSNTEIDVAYVAKLARIALTAEESAEFQGQLEDILGHIDQLKEVDVSAIDLEGALPLGPLRADESRPSPVGQAGTMQNAPESAEGQIRVPKVVDPT